MNEAETASRTPTLAFHVILSLTFESDLVGPFKQLRRGFRAGVAVPQFGMLLSGKESREKQSPVGKAINRTSS